mgnify:CR=1 FL=1
MELPDVPLFRGLTADEAEAAVTALRMRRRAFAKGESPGAGRGAGRTGAHGAPGRLGQQDAAGPGRAG